MIGAPARGSADRTPRHPAVGHLLDLAFLVGVAVKAIDGLAELVGGVALLLVSPAQLAAAVHAVTAGELAEDPHDLIANLIVHGTAGLQTGDLVVIGVTLLVHGVVKAAIVLALIFGAVRVYPWAIAVLAVLTVVQLVQAVLHPSAGLVLLTVLDVAVVALTWREWRHHRGLRETFAETRAWIARR